MESKYRNIAELLAILENQREDLSEKISALQASPASFNEELILKYIETQSTVKAAEFVKEKGVKSPKGTVFSAGDVSAAIKDGGACVNPALLRMAREIFEKNTRAVIRAYG